METSIPDPEKQFHAENGLRAAYSVRVRDKEHSRRTQNEGHFLPTFIFMKSNIF